PTVTETTTEPDDSPSGSLAPLPAELRRRIGQIRSDPPPRKLVRDTHYWISNEQSHFLWHEHVVDRGGALLGVATDQNYLLAGWSRAELLVLMDFDAGVVDLHRAYGVIFADSPSAPEFLARWSAEAEPTVVERLREQLGEHGAAAAAAYASARALVAERLAHVDARYRERGLPTFLSDPEQYEHVRSLWRSGRAIAVRGDLTADLTMSDIATVLREANLEVGVLYLSNAEQYFRYGKAFRRNITALPLAEHGVVLRTNGWRQFGYVDGEEYHYNVQPAPLFAKWMAKGRAWGVPAMLEHKTKTKTRGLSVLDRPPGGSGGPASSSAPSR
ncbi:MAG: hypothetical protein AB1Z98_18590, partial [Nannocystaceae bacterium]